MKSSKMLSLVAVTMLTAAMNAENFEKVKDAKNIVELQQHLSGNINPFSSHIFEQNENISPKDKIKVIVVEGSPEAILAIMMMMHLTQQVNNVEDIHALDDAIANEIKLEK